ncbi:ShlB/FhaC/HecB family hemolysin secretion/activation protein [Vibrio algarum]|uniref:ShlB/FhaC/HecB family hemolysin secretion/activation protein n=1 Tax=Vibrio algarum TaxID=3020714 RepID=A0ABT4YV35_9VIBR|nr:ShlB/FhaC/HecB family hemolysin secretion/activation protein [Vibrio sp. KJ40-1]MDB1125441.1 ShlB/FhaC/HecB family hemolysin secretion/activation protein [Vibrio sp. KJ40-1]
MCANKRVISVSIAITMLVVPLTQAKLTSPTTQLEVEQEQKQRLEAVQTAKESLQNITPLQSIPIDQNSNDITCFDIDSVNFSGNDIFGDSELLALLQFQPMCIGLNTINQYLSIITNYYVEQGYVTSRAFLVPQDLNSGSLEIIIVEGKIESVLLNGQPVSFLKNAFPNSTNKKLNLREIEQGLDQINRLSRYNAQIKMEPGKEQGFSVVNIVTNKGNVGSIGIGFNNGGQKNTGEDQIALNIGLENLFDALDKWSLSANKSSEFSNYLDSENFNLSVDIPRGYWNVNYRTSYSTYLSTFQSNGFKFDSTGKTNSHDLGIKRLFYRDEQSKFSASAGVHHRREKNYILNTLLNTGSRNLSSVSLTLDYSTRIEKGFFTLSPRYHLGTDWFGGEDDHGTSEQAPKAQFKKVTLTASYSYPLSTDLAYSTTWFGQWSDDELYGNERLSIGGEYSVRGFKGASISGDKGFYWRNEVNYPLTSLPYFGRLTANVAVDTGQIIKDSSNPFEQGALTGASVGVNSSSNNLSSSFSIGLPLEAPSRLQNDDYVIYFRLDLKY